MKFIGAIFIVVSCGVVGISLADSLHKRVAILGTLYCLLNDFSISIQYTAPTVWQLLDAAYDNPEYNSLKFLKIFRQDYSEGVTFNRLWNDSITKDTSLKTAEKDVLYSVGNSLGKVGCEECISNLHLAMDRLRLLHTQAIEEYSKKGNLYRWIGILVGIAISIMVV